jgi:hypothetical protein
MTHRRGIDLGYYSNNRVTFVSAVSSLVGHIVGSASLFITIMAVTWSISWSFSYLNEIHNFPEASQRILIYLEVTLLIIDAFLCVALIVFAAKRFVFELGRI